jgi:anti-sigma factor ChrR (cupin superfamily)
MADGRAPTTMHDELITLTLGTATTEELRAARAHVEGCAECKAGQVRAQQALGALGELVTAEQAPPGVKVKLADRIRNESRLTHFAPEVAALFDLPLEEAKALLEKANDPSVWSDGPGPGVQLLPVNAGPKAAEKINALVKVAPGAEFPHHDHPGHEQVMVLEGGYVDSGGVEVWRGEVQVMSEGTSHGFRALGRNACICAASNTVSPP